ncbi:homeobox domain-containing protein 1 [Vairimorpha necatrix]|uniref:Homeobox domain-containing protein 1 n=1 Tax=Vairimorpha necatrix TaxID=6039 RepID=A0AAX4JA52_9MICR
MNNIFEEELKIQAALGLCLLKNGFESSHTKRKQKSKIQTFTLSEVYNITMYPSYQTKIDLAFMLNLNLKTITVWFQNKRQSEKISPVNEYLYHKKAPKHDLSPILLFTIYCKARRMSNVQNLVVKKKRKNKIK